MTDTLQILRIKVREKFQIDPRAWNCQLGAIALTQAGYHVFAIAHTGGASLHDNSSRNLEEEREACLDCMVALGGLTRPTSGHRRLTLGPIWWRSVVYYVVPPQCQRPLIMGQSQLSTTIGEAGDGPRVKGRPTFQYHLFGPKGYQTRLACSGLIGALLLGERSA
ncbi:hypothetical protein CPB86DRAFT_802466 [Serendipita vermifera]|nr:hypothetical protein CPB86DRAFT_802466 [Serendipita vermifera]